MQPSHRDATPADTRNDTMFYTHQSYASAPVQVPTHYMPSTPFYGDMTSYHNVNGLMSYQGYASSPQNKMQVSLSVPHLQYLNQYANQLNVQRYNSAESLPAQEQTTPHNPVHLNGQQQQSGHSQTTVLPRRHSCAVDGRTSDVHAAAQTINTRSKSGSQSHATTKSNAHAQATHPPASRSSSGGQTLSSLDEEQTTTTTSSKRGVTSSPVVTRKNSAHRKTKYFHYDDDFLPW